MMRNPLPSPAFGTLSSLWERAGERAVVSPFTFHLSRQRGFTLVEMIVVIVITGILGGIVAMFIRAPMQGYVDSARRAEMTDIADTALRRITRDLRLALPNSVRVRGFVSGAAGCNGTEACYLEFIPTTGGGRYRTGAPGNTLDFTAADSSFDVIGPMPAFAGGESIVIYNLGIAGADAYSGNNLAACPVATPYCSNGINPLTLGAAKLFPFESPGQRFQVITTPVTYVCAPVAGGVGGTLTRYWGYAIQVAQPTALATLTSVNAGALLATNVSACSFVYDANVVAQRSGLVTMQLTITENNESVTLYNAAHVSNVP